MPSYFMNIAGGQSDSSTQNGGFLSHRGTPSYHPFLKGFSMKLTKHFWVHPWLETLLDAKLPAEANPLFTGCPFWNLGFRGFVLHWEGRSTRSFSSRDSSSTFFFRQIFSPILRMFFSCMFGQLLLEHDANDVKFVDQHSHLKPTPNIYSVTNPRQWTWRYCDIFH